LLGKSIGASADALSDKSDYPYFFRTIATDSSTANAMATLFEQFGYKKVGLIYVNNDVGFAIRNALLQECRKRSIQLISEPYDTGITGPDLDGQTNSALMSLAQVGHKHFDRIILN
jgi:ABC-type branched-subunit amino acid transport system substrate-binding protein